MKIMNHLTFLVTEREQHVLARLGLPLDIGRQRIKLAEDDPKWPLIAPLVTNLNGVNWRAAEFSKSDLKNANFLDMGATSHNGYPQPADDFGYMNVTYDLSNYCDECGVGAVQNAPFRFQRAPVWGKKDILQLNWVFDEFFVPPTIWETLFKPFGVGCRQVLLKSGADLDSVVQLEITAAAHVDVKGLAFELCSVCGRKKYNINSLAYQPKPVSSEETIFHSAEDFGSGALAFKLVLVSNKFYSRVLETGLNGVEFRACAP